MWSMLCSNHSKRCICLRPKDRNTSRYALYQHNLVGSHFTVSKQVICVSSSEPRICCHLKYHLRSNMPVEFFGSEEHTRKRKILPNVNSILHQCVIGRDSLTANHLQSWMPKACVSATLILVKIIEHLISHDFNSNVCDWMFPLIGHMRVVLLIRGRSDGWAQTP